MTCIKSGAEVCAHIECAKIDKTGASDNKLEKFKALYIAANELMMKIGIDGEISIRDPRCNRLMDSLAALDGGEYGVDNVF